MSKMLKPDKWHATFNSEGRVFGFQKALKLILLGGVDPSIRAEVWEFLLGCYAVDSTAEHRRQLRTARRERYQDLIKQCQLMHSSIGTGSLAHVVGSKVMDIRTLSKDDKKWEAGAKSQQVSNDNTNKIDNYSDWNNNCTDASFVCPRESSSDPADFVSMRRSTDGTTHNSSSLTPSCGPYDCNSPKPGSEEHGSQYITGTYTNIPSLSIIDLVEKSGEEKKEHGVFDDRLSTQQKLRFKDENIHRFQINNNADLIKKSNGSASNDISYAMNSEIQMVHSDAHEPVLQSNNLGHKTEINRLRISNVPETPKINASRSQGGAVSKDRVSEWLWTLHRIVIDVVRTDSHLEFYEDPKNLARMSDILAVYAWVDPATGYCQGMSDLLSPFVVLFEDDADAFWSFEMLLRRMCENFQMEGPTGVMKKLQALRHILELTDKEMFAHLSRVGSENLLFAFRMLLVLFRRELSFSDALCMWEMMWAADFGESVASNVGSCLAPLVVQLPWDSGAESKRESMENGNGHSKGGLQSKHGNTEHSDADEVAIRSVSAYPLCGLTKNFWSKNDNMQICAVVSSTRNANDELPVFCVAAILIMNRHKIIRETRSVDDLIKIFNDKVLKINVKRCIRMAIKLRKKYFYKVPPNISAFLNGSFETSVLFEPDKDQEPRSSSC
ncbi:hypothetical protein PVL29_006836 [Vitis rotundifolia]|uniref:Rab-GAP TBC domain-containing protein n=1 Tax=Vitis rotundifolia TaxID=103349 RepID=A0AA39DZD0_VITRO|nr:hypothetical protein PVL29_006836 [Vitis rotundifolia]